MNAPQAALPSVSEASPALGETLAAYERWADSYAAAPHNPLMRAEQEAMLRELPDLRGRHVLDLASGTGRYARIAADAGAAAVVALDYSPSMLARSAAAARVRGDMSRLPFVAQAFDVVVSGLAVGHAPSLAAWMGEVARVLRPGGVLVYSDFHPAAARRGFTRSFEDRDGRACTVPHEVHEVDAQLDAAGWAGLRCESVVALRAGIEFREAFGGSEAFYREHAGLALVLVVRARRSAS